MLYRKKNRMRLYVLKAGVVLVLEQHLGEKRTTSSMVLQNSMIFEDDELRDINRGQMHFHFHNTHYYVDEKDVIVLE